MKGTDVDPQEIDNVRKFLANAGRAGQPQDCWPESNDHEKVLMRRGDMVCLIAWYGAIRAHGRPAGELFRPDTGEKI